MRSLVSRLKIKSFVGVRRGVADGGSRGEASPLDTPWGSFPRQTRLSITLLLSVQKWKLEQQAIRPCAGGS